MSLTILKTCRNILVSFILLTICGTAQAQKTERVARTLELSDKFQIYSYKCKLSISSKSTSKVTIQCKAANAYKKIIKGRSYLRARQSATVKAKGCQLAVLTNSAGLINLQCRAASSPTPSPTATSTPIQTPTPTPIPTATPTPIPTPELSISPTTLILTADGTTGSFTVTNTSSTTAATNIQATLPSGWTDITQDSSNCTNVLPNASCSLSFTPGTTAYTQETIQIQGTNTNSVSADIAIDPIPSTTLVASVSSLAISVSNTSANAALTGTPRVINIVNTGSSTAQAVTFNTVPSLPSGTTINSTCSNLTAGSSCTLTITPGSISDTDPTSVIINGSNTNIITTDVRILDYGSIYQGGYIFAVDDTTPNTSSIGGKVVSTVDQTASLPWDPGCTGSCATTGADSYTDGAANSQAIYSSLSSEPANSYAAGLCLSVIAGYSDWYLPALCEQAYGNSSCGTAISPAVQNIQSNLIDPNLVTTNISGYYWSSTQSSFSPILFAELTFFDSGNPIQLTQVKNNTFAVRCVRSLTY